jgi:hypothetical protein
MLDKMSFYTEQVNNIQGDTLIINASQPFERTRGLYELVDWKLGGVLSNAIIKQHEQKLKEAPILIPSYGKLPVERIIFIPIGKSIKTDIIRSLKGLGSKSCTISFPKSFKKDLKAYFFEEFANSNFQWQRIEEIKTYDECLVVLSKIQYK